MSDYILMVTSETVAPVNMPSFIHNLEKEELTSFEILGKLYEHKAIFVKPKASQIGILRSVAALSSIDMVLFLPEEEVVSTTYLSEMSGLPRVVNIADIEASYDPGETQGTESRGGEAEEDKEQESEQEEELISDQFVQGA